MPKPRHENPYAERRIVELDLPRWRSRRELDALARERARRERLRAELAAVPWAELSPAELAFVYMLHASARPTDSLRGEFSKWAAAVRESRGLPRASSDGDEQAPVRVGYDDSGTLRAR